MHYKSAPIREAIFDIRIDSLTNSSLDKLEKIHDIISDKYPDKKKQMKFVGKFEFDKGVLIKNKSDSEIRGFLFSKKNNKSKVQIRFDGFTYNMLKPYSDWSKFSNEALRLWKLYKDNLGPKKITRIALRYINKIEIPMPFDKFQDYIVNMPPIPKCLPQVFQNFFMQIEVPCDDSSTNVILTETIQNPKNNLLPFILDIDTYKKVDFDSNRRIIRSDFEKLQKIKNETFENCITNKTRKLFR